MEPCIALLSTLKINSSIQMQFFFSVIRWWANYFSLYHIWQDRMQLSIRKLYFSEFFQISKFLDSIELEKSKAKMLQNKRSNFTIQTRIYSFKKSDQKFELSFHLNSNCCSLRSQCQTVRNLHFLSKNSTLISRQNCRFLSGEKLVKMLWFWTF